MRALLAPSPHRLYLLLYLLLHCEPAALPAAQRLDRATLLAAALCGGLLRGGWQQQIACAVVRKAERAWWQVCEWVFEKSERPKAHVTPDGTASNVTPGVTPGVAASSVTARTPSNPRPFRRFCATRLRPSRRLRSLRLSALRLRLGSLCLRSLCLRSRCLRLPGLCLSSLRLRSHSVAEVLCELLVAHAPQAERVALHAGEAHAYAVV
mmetsp:Transcript_8990/g.21660  ORF Transcript_8990/g.21660 Transcript_8990/m.21660 type:complete len:209 (-) Transcript_8990:889-1515(-)